MPLRDQRSAPGSESGWLEEYMINIVNRSIGLFILAGAILAPAATIAAPGPQEAGVSVRVYPYSG